MFSSLRYWFLIFCLTLSIFFQNQIVAEEPPANSTTKKTLKIAIIIDDLGHKYIEGLEAINLDIPLAVAVLPFTPHGKKLAELAHQNKQDVMLHLPMQPSSAMHLMTENTLSIQMMQDEFKSLVSRALDDIPHVVGVNNHMGSLFTQLPDQMGWLMSILQSKSKSLPKDLFFIDSFTSQFSVGYQIADMHDVSTARRDVFLDKELNPKHMQAQIETIKRTARANGYAIAIGHPFPETLALLKTSIPELQKQGFEFVKITELLDSDMLRSALDKQISKKPKK